MIASLRKADFLLFFSFLIIAALVAAAPLVRPAGDGQKVRVIYREEVVGIYPLEKDTDVEVERNGHLNVISIQNNSVYMKYSDCKNQVCVNTGKISRTGQIIVCLPNYVIVEIIGSEEGGGEDETVDAIAK